MQSTARWTISCSSQSGTTGVFSQKSQGQVNAPLWTGIRVRQSGELYDPLTNTTLKVAKDNPTLFHSVHSSWETAVKSRKCIFLDNAGYFVETICAIRTVVDVNSSSLRCACYQGKGWKQLASLGSVYFSHQTTFKLTADDIYLLWEVYLDAMKSFFIWDSNRERKRTKADLENKIRERRLPNVSSLGLYQWNKIRGPLILFHWWSPSDETFGNLRSLILFSKSAFVLFRSLFLSQIKKFYGFSRLKMQWKAAFMGVPPGGGKKCGFIFGVSTRSRARTQHDHLTAGFRKKLKHLLLSLRKKHCFLSYKHNW